MTMQPDKLVLSGQENHQLEIEIQRLVKRYGPDAVRNLGLRATSNRVGRKEDNDWPRLIPWLEMDARDWLDGRDPEVLRKPFYIGTKIARLDPGHNEDSTRARIRSKLKRKRTPAFLLVALAIAMAERPLDAVYRVIEELPVADPRLEWLAATLADILRDGLDLYRHRIGEPQPGVSFAQMRSELAAIPIVGIGSGLLLERNRE